jgi:hypothetical protein
MRACTNVYHCKSKYCDNPAGAFLCQHDQPTGPELRAGADDFAHACEETRRVWTRAYPDEPFFLDEEAAGVGEPCDGIIDGYDVGEAAERQSSFLW